jgi:hypothetical protein
MLSLGALAGLGVVLVVTARLARGPHEVSEVAHG